MYLKKKDKKELLMLSNKFVNSEKITSVDSDKIITNDKEIAKILNHFLSNIIKN